MLSGPYFIYWSNVVAAPIEIFRFSLAADLATFGSPYLIARTSCYAVFPRCTLSKSRRLLSKLSKPTTRSRRCRLERLEGRLALDGDGGTLISLDPHFTLSFADDGTPVAGQTSNLESLLDAIAPRTVWREQILRGFQTWAVLTNADIGVVADEGQAFGTPGSGRSDPRFGDIRIGALAADSSVGAVSVPVDNLVSGTWLADVLFNNQFNYQTTDHILAVAMHEAGNVFGLEDNTTPGSPLNSSNGPVVSSPTPADIAAIQALHGVRPDDFNEVHQHGSGSYTDNNVLTNATRLELGKVRGEDEGSAPTVLYGDITTLADIDYFNIETPDDYYGEMSVVLRSSGISLLNPELTLLNSSGQQISHSSSQIAGGATLSLQIPNVAPGEQYYIRAASATSDVFGIGSYSLTTAFSGLNQVDPVFTAEVASGTYRFLETEEIAKLFDVDGSDFYNDDDHTDDEADFGTELETTVGFVEGTRYDATASIADSTDIDYYRIESPESPLIPLDTMTVAIHSLDAGELVPFISVLDENQTPLSARIVANGGGDLVIQVTGIEAEKEYFIVVEAANTTGPFTTGNYDLQVVFTESPTDLTSVASGAVGEDVGQRIHTLHVGQPQLFHFVLEAGAANVSVPSAVVATIRSDTGDVVARIASPPGERRSLSAVLLNPGTYTVDFVTLSLDESTSPSLNYDLLATSISDPFVGDPSDPTGHPFACPENADFFCYPGLPDPIADPFLWDDFIDSLATTPPALGTSELIDLLVGDWWSWLWDQFGENGPPLALDDTFTYTINGASGALQEGANVLNNDIDAEGETPVVTQVTSSSSGSATVDPDGTLSFTPSPGYVGTARLTYVASDSLRESLIPGVVRIVVSSGLAGDYNADGIVDTTDYAMWKANFGSIEELTADGNRDGVVNAVDFTIWRDNLGATLAAAATAPALLTTQSAAVGEDAISSTTSSNPSQPQLAANGRPFSVEALAVQQQFTMLRKASQSSASPTSSVTRLLFLIDQSHPLESPSSFPQRTVFQPSESELAHDTAIDALFPLSDAQRQQFASLLVEAPAKWSL